AEQITIKEALQHILQNTGLKYVVSSSRHLILVEAKAQSSQETITGTVTDAEGVPLAGVNVLVKGSNIGTATDSNGYYEIRIEDDAVLIFSMVGFQTVEMETNGRTEINVTLLKETIGLDEVTVVGFNEIETEHVASAVATVEPEAIQSQPVAKLQE